MLTNTYHTVASEMKHLFSILTLRKYYGNKVSSSLESVVIYMMTTEYIFGPAHLKFIIQTEGWWIGFFILLLFFFFFFWSFSKGLQSRKSFGPCEIGQQICIVLLNCTAAARIKRE